MDQHANHMTGALNGTQNGAGGFSTHAPQRRPGISSPHIQGQLRRAEWLIGTPLLPAQHAVDLPSEIPLIIAVGGGKGGVGKSLLSANLASKLVRNGLKVLCFDLDFGGPNLHTYFGLDARGPNLSDVVVSGKRALEDVILQTPVQGCSMIPGARSEGWGREGVADSTALGQIFDAVVTARSRFGSDVVILDLGAGTQFHTIDMFLMAHLGIVTALPEPTSIENAYMFLKTALWRIIDHVGLRSRRLHTGQALKEALTLSDNQGLQSRGYAERIRSLSANEPEFLRYLFAALSGRRAGIVINQARTQQDVNVGASMELIATRYFGFQSRFLGHLNFDDVAWKSLRNRRLLTIDFPQAILSHRLNDIASRALNLFGL
jgi:flagellar biosynthesis protein FlhG